MRRAINYGDGSIKILYFENIFEHVWESVCYDCPPHPTHTIFRPSDSGCTRCSPPRSWMQSGPRLGGRSRLSARGQPHQCRWKPRSLGSSLTCDPGNMIYNPEDIRDGVGLMCKFLELEHSWTGYRDDWILPTAFADAHPFQLAPCRWTRVSQLAT